MKGLALVTGGNTGIGGAIAESMAARGYDVRILCRSRQRAEAFIAKAGEKGPGRIGFIEADLGSVESTKSVADRIRRECPEFSVFIHNAGIWPVRRHLNADGLEESFVTDHLAPFILNILLEDLFVQNKCRMVQVSAGLYIAGMKDYESAATGRNFSILKTYATVKLFNLICTMKFAERWRDKGVLVNAVHPGVVRTGLGDMEGIMGLVLRAAKRFWLPPPEGARAPVMLADDPAYASVSGRYFERFTEKPLAPIALDPSFNDGVWHQAMSLAFDR